MPPPNMEAAVKTDGFDARVIESYTAQLYLRQHLNTLHNTFYRPESGKTISPSSTFDINVSVDLTPVTFVQMITASAETLEMSIKIWAQNMQWDMDKGEPATDILEARLRAKYYGAQVITYRHFILKILQGSVPPPPNRSKDTFYVHAIAADEFTIKEYASKGLRALIHSTRAFHALGPPWEKRLIVTNVWGTAHAYAFYLNAI
jgi:hypothetical protein